VKNFDRLLVLYRGELRYMAEHPSADDDDRLRGLSVDDVDDWSEKRLNEIRRRTSRVTIDSKLKAAAVTCGIQPTLVSIREYIRALDQ
jgi:hypothetical protein